MELKLGATVSYFLWSLGAGVLLALLYDFFRTARRIFKTSVFGINLEDIVFVVGAGCLIFWLGYDKNDGVVRVQGFLGIFLGFFFYRKIFKDYMVRFLVWLSGVLRLIVIFLFKILLVPVKVIFHFFSKPFLVIAWYSRQGVNRIERIIRTTTRRKFLKRKCEGRRRQLGKKKKNLVHEI